MSNMWIPNLLGCNEKKFTGKIKRDFVNGTVSVSSDGVFLIWSDKKDKTKNNIRFVGSGSSYGLKRNNVREFTVYQ